MITAFFRDVIDRLNRLSEVESVAVTYSLPMSTVALAWEPIRIENYAPKSTHELIISNVRIVSPDYFRTMGIPLVKGRYFDQHDTKDAPETVIVDETLAQRFWPHEDPIGKRIQRGGSGAWRTIVGVISNARQYSSEKEPPIAVYFPFEQYVARNMFLVTRTTIDPATTISTITKEIQSIDPEMPVFDVGTMDQRLSDSLASRRFAMILLALFAAVASLLAAIGIFGVMAYTVNERTHEIGIRLALGSPPSRILQLVIKQAVAMTSVGVAIGLGCAFGLTRVLAALLFGVTTTDVLTFTLTPVVLAVVALLASYLPARRAARVDPMIALKCE